MFERSSHEWVHLDGEVATVGITAHALRELGEIVYVELPPLASEVEEGEEVAVLESAKAAIDLYAPVEGTVIAVNERLGEEIELLNQSPEGEGWLFRLRISAPKGGKR